MVQGIHGRVGRFAGVLLALLLSAAGAVEAAEPEEAIRPPIDINAASAAELTRLPGIGETTAQRIVEFREQNGPFGRIEDLMKVKGIGEKSFEKLRPSITVGTPKPRG
jgi:competence protein ComEA